MTSLTPPTRPPPRWLPPAEREDMWLRAMKEEGEYWAAQPRPKPPARVLTLEEMDESDSRKQIAGLEAVIAERHFTHTAPAAWARVFEPARYPRLRAVGKRAGPVGAARFKGRYHPHLIWDAGRD